MSRFPSSPFLFYVFYNQIVASLINFAILGISYKQTNAVVLFDSATETEKV